MNPLRMFLMATLFLAFFGSNEADAENNNTTMVAPDFTLKDTEENTFSLSDYEEEKIVILLFMFTTCEPCERFVNGALEPYSKNMDNGNVTIISVSVFGEDDESELRNYALDYGWRHALGDPNGDIEIAYDVTGTPKLFIINEDGLITYKAGGATGKSVPNNPEDLELVVYNGTLTDEEETYEEETEGDVTPSVSMIPALISVGLIALFRRK